MFRLFLFCFFLLFVLYPLGHLFFYVSPSSLNGQFLVPFYNSLKLGSTVGLIATLCGFLLAFSTTQKKFWGRSFFSTMATLPLISPPFILSLSAILLFGRQGLLAHLDIYGFWGLTFVEVLAYTPTAYLLLKGVLDAIPSSMKEAALNLGASRRQTFYKILFPLTKHGLLSAFLLVFMESLADFGNPLILSGSFEVLAVKAYMEMTAFYDVGNATTMAFFLLAPSLIAFFAQRAFLRKSVVVVGGKQQSSSFDWLRTTPKIFLFIFCLFFSVIVVLMYGMILAGAFRMPGLIRPGSLEIGWTLSNFSEVLQLSRHSLIDSILLALVAAPITGLLGMGIAYLVVRKNFLGRRLLEAVTLFAFAIPGTVLGISYALAFNKPFFLLPALQGSAWIILLLFVVRNLPVGLQAGVACLKQVDKSIEEAAVTLGCSGFKLFYKIVLPLIAPAFFTGWAYSFVKAITAISAVIFVVSGNWNLVTVDILGLVENGELSYAAALSLLLILIVLFVLGSIKVFIGMVSTKGLGGALRGTA